MIKFPPFFASLSLAALDASQIPPMHPAMPPRGIFRLWAAALMAIGAGHPVMAEQNAKPQLAVEEFIGGTGASASDIVRKCLERSGKFELSPRIGQWLVRASSSAGRIDGALVATNGSVLFNNHYDSADLLDNAKAYADDIIDALTGERGIALSRIAFVSDQSGAKEIYICDSDGQRVQQITRDRSVSVSPSLGPGGALLAYTSYVSGFPDVYVTSMKDGTRQRIISSPGTNSGAAFSHDGTRLALTMTHDGDPEIYITTVGGSRSKRVTESKSVEFSPAWAPDGERLVFCSDATGSPQLYICPRRGGDPERLATGVAKCTDPDWNADGHLIAFTAWKGGDKSVALYEMETGRTRTVLANASHPSWAPDGRHLVAVQSNALVVFNVVTGSKERILSGMGKISEPAWSR
jgi:TolB protein